MTAHRFADLGRAPTFSDTAVEVAPVELRAVVVLGDRTPPDPRGGGWYR